MTSPWRSHPERRRGPTDRSAGFRHRYEGFRNLLDMNSELLELLGELEADLRNVRVTESVVRQPTLQLLDGTRLLVDTLNVVADGRFSDLLDVHARIETKLRDVLRSSEHAPGSALAFDLGRVGTGDDGQVGGKAANLGAVKAAIPEHVPDGFVIGTEGYWLFMGQGGVWSRLRVLLSALDVITDRDLFRARTRAIREMLTTLPVPEVIATAIRERAAALQRPHELRWAVRSSGVAEDGAATFAGQFDTLLDVPDASLVDAYRSVLVSRFSDRAVTYRLAAGFAEVETPMAVLFLPMLAARSAGVLYTRDPQDSAADRMLVNATRGLADRLVAGRAPADLFVVRRSAPGALIARQLAEPTGGTDAAVPSVVDEELRALGRLALAVENTLGRPQDIEWVLDDHGKLWVVQSRPLKIASDGAARPAAPSSLAPALTGGMTIAPGCAAGHVEILMSLDEIAAVKDDAVLVVPQAVPELGGVLPRLAGLIAVQGNPAGHLAALLREFGVPSLFGLAEAPVRLRPGQPVTLDATARAVYPGPPSPDLEARVVARLGRIKRTRAPSPLHDLVLRLNLTEPTSRSFRPSGCRSLHDIIRFCHEQAVRSLFDTSDSQVASLGNRPLALKSEVALPFVVLDLGGSIDPESGTSGFVVPGAIRSRPFQALWKGVTTPGVSWTGRSAVSLSGFASVLVTQQVDTGPRALGEPNYLLVSPDYLNVNARLAYHFAMVDAWVEEAAENNFVNFHFRGGGASARRRDLRVRFLGEVLRRSGFGVDDRGDLMTAWLRRYPRELSEEGLTVLGRLMGCARQLDMLMDAEGAVQHYVDRFLAQDYAAFG